MATVRVTATATVRLTVGVIVTVWKMTTEMEKTTNKLEIAAQQQQQQQQQQQLEKRENESQMKPGTCQKVFKKGTADWSSTEELQRRAAKGVVKKSCKLIKRSCSKELQRGVAKGIANLVYKEELEKRVGDSNCRNELPDSVAKGRPRGP